MKNSPSVWQDLGEVDSTRCEEVNGFDSTSSAPDGIANSGKALSVHKAEVIIALR